MNVFINMNDKVAVRLTPLGRKIYRNHCKKHRTSTRINMTRQGVLTEQLYELFVIFGPHIMIGMDIFFVDNEIVMV